MDLRNASNLCFLFLVCLCTILGRLVFDFRTKQNENDVFLNFRGEDTRYGLISHLDEALSRRKVKTFIDEVLPRGEDLASLLKEIEASRVAVVVFSEDYASSTWCLDELVRITECSGILGMKVLPIFYRINSSDVSNQNGSFQAAFDRHEKDFKDKLHIVQRWRAALMEVSRPVGLDSRRFGHENDLVKKAVDEVAKLLRVSRSEEETAAGDFRSSATVTAYTLFVVLLGFWFHDLSVYLCTLESYSDVLALGTLRSNPQSSSEISVVVILIVIIWLSGIFWSKYISNEGEGEADQFNNNGSNANDNDENSAENCLLNNDEDLAENSQSTTVMTPGSQN